MNTDTYWQLPKEKTYSQLETGESGLSWQEAKKRLKRDGPNRLKPSRSFSSTRLFFSQFTSPIIVLLLAAALLSCFLGGVTDAAIIFVIVFLSGLLGFFQERGAVKTIKALLSFVANKTDVLRDGNEVAIPVEEVVVGDMIVLRAGDIVPADAVIIEAKHFFVDESALTGESVPVEKIAGEEIASTPPLQSKNALFLGTTVASGVAKALVVATALNTEYSKITEHVSLRAPETAFEIGVRSFGYFLMEVTLVLTIVIFACNIFFQKPIVDSFLFSLALAVGLTPQLLPAIISVNLSHGARKMAERKVITKRLSAIENFGSMDVLCADKTGTLTEGALRLEKAVSFAGENSEKVALYGYLNAHFQSGYINPLDEAILHKLSFDVFHWHKVDETPYDFIRKRLSVVLENGNDRPLLIAKGAAPQVLEVCDTIELPSGKIEPIAPYKAQILEYFESQAEQGFRLIAVAYGNAREEVALTFLGFLLFFDPVKKGAREVLASLLEQGVKVKIITGDHIAVARHVAEKLGLQKALVLSGKELHEVNDIALVRLVHEKVVFAEIEPNQKERIILALKKAGSVVGFIGDGVNDVAALHAADVSIAVDSGAESAKEVADIVLLEKDLAVLQEGISEGRKTFANTLKYVYMATSANFGNMFSMAVASLFLPFLPLLPKQILLTNFLSDMPEMSLAQDSVDNDVLKKRVVWNLQRIRRFMLVFGVISAFADFFTFIVLLFYYQADSALFRSGWFVENVVTASAVVLALRTKHPFLTSRPSRLLLMTVCAVASFAMWLPYTTFGALFELVALPASFYLFLAGIITLYLTAVEVAKRYFFTSRI